MHRTLFALSFLILGQSGLATFASVGDNGSVYMTSSDTDKSGTQTVKKKKHKSRSGGLENESYEDLNLFQLKPSVINEQFYASGKNEKSLKTSPTLPFGAEIPDTDNYVMPAKPLAKTDTATAATMTNTELHSAIIDGNLAENIKQWSQEPDDSHLVELNLQVTDCTEELINKLKERHAQILSTGTTTTIKIPARRIQSISELKQVTRISLH